ncbi:MAG: hypothetical protein AABW58_04760 [Nanoarchaeota archaeon]
MPKIKYKILCKRCKKYYSPEKTKMSYLGYCKECSFIPGKCRFMAETGYPCQNDAEMFGYCVEHFLKVPIKSLTDKIKKL